MRWNSNNRSIYFKKVFINNCIGSNLSSICDLDFSKNFCARSYINIISYFR